MSIKRLNKYMLYDETEIEKAILAAERKSAKTKDVKTNGDIKAKTELGIALLITKRLDSFLENTNLLRTLCRLIL